MEPNTDSNLLSISSIESRTSTSRVSPVPSIGGERCRRPDVRPPWRYELTPSDFADSFEMNMGFCDAYRLWIMSSFDDDRLVREMHSKSGIPDEWADWINEQTDFG